MDTAIYNNQVKTIDWLMQCKNKYNIKFINPLFNRKSKDSRSLHKELSINEYIIKYTDHPIHWYETYLKRELIDITISDLFMCSSSGVTIMFILNHLKNDIEKEYLEFRNLSIIIYENTLVEYLYIYNIPIQYYDFIQVKLGDEDDYIDSDDNSDNERDESILVPMSKFMETYNQKQQELKRIYLDFIPVDDLCDMIIL